MTFIQIKCYQILDKFEFKRLGENKIIGISSRIIESDVIFIELENNKLKDIRKDKFLNKNIELLLTFFEIMTPPPLVAVAKAVPIALKLTPALLMRATPIGPVLTFTKKDQVIYEFFDSFINAPKKLEPEEYRGQALVNLLRLFENIQKNYNSIELGGYYMTETETVKLEKLPIKIVPNYSSNKDFLKNMTKGAIYVTFVSESEDSLTAALINFINPVMTSSRNEIKPHAYFTFIHEDTGMVKKTAQIQAIGYALATSFQENKQFLV